jgi:hypothetical protein
LVSTTHRRFQVGLSIDKALHHHPNRSSLFRNKYRIRFLKYFFLHLLVQHDDCTYVSVGSSLNGMPNGFCGGGSLGTWIFRFMASLPPCNIQTPLNWASFSPSLHLCHHYFEYSDRLKLFSVRAQNVSSPADRDQAFRGVVQLAQVAWQPFLASYPEFLRAVSLIPSRSPRGRVPFFIKFSRLLLCVF